MAIQDFLKSWGLLAVFVGAATEGEATLLLAGVMAHLGLVDLAGAIAAGTLGGLATDLVAYGVGRVRADVVRATLLYRRLAPVVERFTRVLGAWQVLVARFIYGTNLATMFFWGVRDLPFLVFGPLAFAGCALWASLLTTLGYVMSRSAKALIGDVEEVERWLLGASILAVTVSVTLRSLLRRRRVAKS